MLKRALMAHDNNPIMERVRTQHALNEAQILIQNIILYFMACSILTFSFYIQFFFFICVY